MSTDSFIDDGVLQANKEQLSICVMSIQIRLRCISSCIIYLNYIVHNQQASFSFSYLFCEELFVFLSVT